VRFGRYRVGNFRDASHENRESACAMSFASMLQGLTAARVRFVVVGGVAAAAHGSAHVTVDLDVCYDTASENVVRLAALLAEWDAYPRGVEQGLPFFMDERQFRTTPLMTLTTREGDLDVLDRVAGVGDYAKTLEQSVEFQAFDVRFPALDLPALIRAKRAAGRPKDMAHLPELEALAALLRKSR
jgi:hypothetical protein